MIPGVPTEHGHDSVTIRIQNLRRGGQVASAGINAGSHNYGDNCEGSDCGHNGRVCGTQWCFDMFLQEPECLDQVRLFFRHGLADFFFTLGTFSSGFLKFLYSNG